MTVHIDGDSVRIDRTSIDSTDSPYTTQGEDRIHVDTSSGAVTVTLASADVDSDRSIKIVDTGLNASTNNITINTEGTETINPGASASISITVDGSWVDIWSDGSNWFVDRAVEVQSIADGATTIYDGTNLVADVNNASVTTAEGEITNETFIRATRGSNNSGVSAGTYVNAFDGESKDNRGEFNSSAQFTPDKTGEYEIVAQADIRGSTTAGDDLSMRIRTTGGTTPTGGDGAESVAPDSAALPREVFVVQLDAGTTYEVQVTNEQSSFEVNTFATTGTIVRSVVQ